jgi:hypothetical protein
MAQWAWTPWARQRVCAISHYGSKLSGVGGASDMNYARGQVILQSPIVAQGNFASVTGNETNGIARGLLALGGMGGGMAKVSFKYEVKDPAGYSKKVQAASSQAITLFLDQVNALR